MQNFLNFLSLCDLYNNTYITYSYIYTEYIHIHIFIYFLILF